MWKWKRRQDFLHPFLCGSPRRNASRFELSINGSQLDATTVRCFATEACAQILAKQVEVPRPIHIMDKGKGVVDENGWNFRGRNRVVPNGESSKPNMVLFCLLILRPTHLQFMDQDDGRKKTRRLPPRTDLIKLKGQAGPSKGSPT